MSDVVHGANLTVDEQGTVAAAATAAIMATSAPLEVEQVTVDRPFLFALRDIPTGACCRSGDEPHRAHLTAAASRRVPGTQPDSRTWSAPTVVAETVECRS